MEPRSEAEREKETPATGEPSPAASSPGIAATAGIAVAFTILGALLTMLATGLQGASLSAERRQATALESIATSLRVESLDTPGAAPMVWEESSGADICSIVEDELGLRVEGADPLPCVTFLAEHPYYPDEGPNL